MVALAHKPRQTESDSGELLIVPVPYFEWPFEEFYRPRRKPFSVPVSNEPITLPRARLAVLGALVAYEGRRVPQDYLHSLVPELDERQVSYLWRQLKQSSQISVDDGYAVYLGQNGKSADTGLMQRRITTEQALPLVLGLIMAYEDINISHDILRSWTRDLTNQQFGILLAQLKRVPHVRVESTYVTYRKDGANQTEVLLPQLDSKHSEVYHAIRMGYTDTVLLEELFPDRRVPLILQGLKRRGAIERVGEYGIHAVPLEDINLFHLLGLTDREIDVLGMRSAGYGNDELAERLIIERRTVERHIGGVVKKLGISSEFDVITKAGIMYRELFPHEATQPEFPVHLTPRQLEVYDLIAKGYNNAKIAEELGMAPRTLERPMHDIFEALNIPPGYSKREYTALLRDRIKVEEPFKIESSPFHLTEREIEVIELIWRGHSNKEIARRLYIQPRTVEHHVTSIIGKTGVGSDGFHPRVKMSLDWMKVKEYRSERSPFIDQLTEREREVLGMLMFHNKIIAERLGIQLRTVEHHIYSIFGKLEVDGYGQSEGRGSGYQRVRAVLAAGVNQVDAPNGI